MSRATRTRGGNAKEDDHEALAKEAEAKARACMQKKDANYREALRYYSEAVRLDPKMANYYYSRANCYVKLGEYKLALFDYTMGIQIEVPHCTALLAAETRSGGGGGGATAATAAAASSNDQGAKRLKVLASYYGARGQCFRQMGKVDDSLADFRKARQCERENGQWNYEMGVSLYDLGDKAGALVLLDAAIDERKGQKPLTGKIRTKALIYRGNTKRELNRIPQSIEDLTKAVEAEDAPATNNVLGLSYFEQREYKAAGACFQKATELDPKSAIYFNNLGLALFQQGRHGDALANFKEAGIRDPDNANIYFNRGNAQLAQGDHDNALESFTAAIERNSDDENMYHSRGIVFQEKKNFPAAIKEFHKALALNPNFRPSLFHLGLMYHCEKDHFKALECFCKVIKDKGDDRRAFESLGLVYCDLLYFDLAVGAFTKAIDLWKGYGVNYFYRGKALLWLGRYEEAVANFNDAMSAKEKCEEPQVYNCRALALKYTFQYGAAIQDLTTAIEADSSNVEFWYNRALCYLDIGEYPLAAEDLTKALAHDPSESRLYYLRGKAQYALNRFNDTIADLEKALELDPNAPDAHDCHFYMGIALANSAKHGDALKCFSSAVTLKPNTATYTHERAKSLQHEGRYQEAVVDFTKVISLQPLNAHAYFRRGFALKSIGRFEEAADDFEMARKLQPKNSNLVVNYKKVYDIDFIELCAAGEEPSYEQMVGAASSAGKQYVQQHAEGK